MRVLFVVEMEVALEAVLELRRCFVGVQVDVLVFEGAPESLDEDIVEGTPAPIHADEYPGVLESGRPLAAGELSALIGIKSTLEPRFTRIVSQN